MADEQTVDFGDNLGTELQIPLEQKYREQMRQIISQKIELPISTLPEMIREQINLNPDFQRRDRWNQEKQSRFIESIIMNVPIPPVFLGESEYGTYVVLDGRQRLTAIHEFLRNTYKLKGLEVWAELNDQSFNDLQKKKLDRAITRRFVPAIVILKESSSEVKYDVFDRLNTGGVIAEPMEIRNAIFQGEFNRLLHVLSGDHTFRRLWDIPVSDEDREQNSMYQKMTDLELVLRFFALQNYAQMNLRFKDFLGDFMEDRNKEYKQNLVLKREDTELFMVAVRNCWQVFGEQAFRKPGLEGPYSKKSAPLADAVLAALSDVQPEQISDDKATQIRAAINGLCEQDEAFRKAISTGTNGKGAIRTRIELARKAVHAIVQTPPEAQ